MIYFQDKAILKRIKEIVGHSNPFSQKECLSIRTLKVSYARHYEDLNHLPNIEHLELFACDIYNLLFLNKLQNLKKLIILCTPISNVSPILQCQNLEYIDISFTSVEEVACLLEIPSLKKGRFVGNPLNEKSDTIFRNLPSEQGVFELSALKDWQFCTQIRSLGLEMNYSGFGSSKHFLVKPGIPEYTNGNCDFLSNKEYKVEFLLYELKQLQSTKISPSIIFNILDQDERNSSERFLSLYTRRKIGTARDAFNWIHNSPVSQIEKSNFVKFVDKYSKLLFFSEEKTLLDNLADTHQVKLPNWFKTARSTLTFVQPNHDVSFQLNYDLDSSFENVWFQLGSNYSEELLLSTSLATKFKPFIFASSLSSNIVLAIDTQNNDNAIYVFDLNDMGENQEESNIDSISPIFGFYSELLSQIEAIRLPDGTIYT